MAHFLTGHGEDGRYLHKIGKREDESCVDCLLTDGKDHAVFECPRWFEERREAFSKIGEVLTPDNIVQKMCQNETNWRIIQRFITLVIGTRERTCIRDRG
ncbi:hypothetical protein RI129_009664 [Pyrocoelia pectoralis]|uniref:Reverse transcriptase n=1 Tax=Pyrocoelia pectoralis TaxID=417401 RepID=A0AAN7ZF43_9COLE